MLALATPHAFLALVLVRTCIGQSRLEVLDCGELRASIFPAAYTSRVVM